LHGDPRKAPPLFGHLLAQLRVLVLELRKLAASRLPILSGSNGVVVHRYLLWRSLHQSRVGPRSHIKTGAPPRTHRPALGGRSGQGEKPQRASSATDDPLSPLRWNK